MNFHQTILPLFQQTRAQWLHEARIIAHKLALAKADRGEPAQLTTDEIHKYCPVPDGIDPRVMGAVFTRESWRKVGYVSSTRAACHHRPIALFQLV